MISIKSALKQQIVNIITADYLMGLRDKNTGFSGVSAWLMIDYLYTNHGNIKNEDVVVNKHRLTNPFDPTQTIFDLFNCHK